MASITRKEILQGFRTQSLLEATRRIIANEGFQAVTMERVAGQAGITKGAVYLYFRNKEQMILSAVEQLASQTLKEIEGQVDPKATPWTRLCQVVRAQMETLERHRDVLRTLLLFRWLMSDPHQRRKWRPLLRYREKHLRQLQAILDEGARQKAFARLDAATAAFYINEMILSTSQRRMMGLSHADLKGETEELIGFISALLRNKNSRKSEGKL